MSFDQVFHRIKQILKYSDFYKCHFNTWDNKKDRIVLRPHGQNLALISVGINVVYFLFQITAAIKAPKSSLIDTVETLGIITMGFIVILLRFDLDMDYVPTQLLNYIYDFKGESIFIK